jgi:hypothetical protein
MAHDQQFDQRRATADAQTADTAVDTAPPATTYVTTGPIPPVETATGKPSPTASERAFGTGPGVQALEALLAKGMPKTGDIVALIDAHRDEHDAMLALVEQKLGAEYARTVRGAMDHLRASIQRKEIVAGDPGDPAANYLEISQKQNGAKWRAADGKFTGTANKDGLDTTVQVDAKDSIHAKVKPDKSATVDWDHDGKTEAELYGHYGSGKDYEAGIRRTDGAVTKGFHHQVAGGHTTDAAYADYKKDDTTAHAEVGMKDGKAAGSLSADATLGKDHITGSVAHDGTGTTAEIKNTHDFGHGTTGTVDVKSTNGALSESATLTHKGTHDTETAAIAHDAKGTTGKLSASYENGPTKLDGNVARETDKWTMHAGASHDVSKQLSISGHVDETIPDKGKPQTTLGVSEKYKSGNVIQGLDLEAGKGEHDYLKATGSVSGKLAPNLYGSGWGSYSYEAGHQNTAQLGASLTFTPQEKQALTLAGVLDEHGRVETRLQYDIFKDRINSIADLDQHKKDAMISVFISYSQQVGGHRALDDRFGAPQFETPGNGSQVMAGIRFRF